MARISSHSLSLLCFTTALVSFAVPVCAQEPIQAQEWPQGQVRRNPLNGFKDASILSVEEVQALDPEELRQYRNFTAEQIAALSPEQLQALSPEQLEAVEPAVGPVAGVFGVQTLLGVGGTAAAVGGVAAATSGGGGDDSGDSVSSTPPPESDPAPAPPPPPAAPTPSITEESRQAGWVYVGADYAQAIDITGKGVNVAVLDTLIDPLSYELKNTLLDCYNAVDDTEGCVENATLPQNGHGTFISGILAADDNDVYMVGVAPGANLLNAGIFFEDDTGFDVRLIGVGADKRAKALNWAVANEAQVSNHSYGYSGAYNSADYAARIADYAEGTDIHAAIDNAVNNDVVIVWASGNDGLDQPSTQAALPLDYPEWAQHWLVATAVDTVDGQIASYANKCGDTAAFCLAAPGGDPFGDGGLYSYTSQDYIAKASGTSFAAPHVTGAVALAIEKFGAGTSSNLSNERIVDLILGTANDGGVYADEATYGQGLLDIEAALRYDPSSGVFATGESFESGAQLVRSTRIDFGAAFGNGAVRTLGAIKAGASDKFGRMSMVDLGALAHHADHSINSAELLLNFGEADLSTHKIGSLGEVRLRFSQDDGVAQGEKTSELESLSFVSSFDEDFVRLQVDYKRNPAMQLGFYAQEGAFSHEGFMEASGQSLIPYLDFAGDRAMSAGLQMSFNTHSRVKMLGFSTIGEDLNGDALDDPAQEDESDIVSGFAFETDYGVSDAIRVSLLGGMMREEDFVLGTRSDGAFSLQKNTPTLFSGVNLHYQFENDMRFIAGAQAGWTEASAVDDSLYSSFSSVKTDSYTLGLLLDNYYREQDQIGFLVHQPLRVSSAQADIRYPVARGDNGSALFESQSVDLEPDGREVNFQAYYRTTLSEKRNDSLNVGLLYRHEPGHIEDSSADGLAIMRYKVDF
ncbi:MAG: S8 family peptidase [Alphaproteobacteria bacterium]